MDASRRGTWVLVRCFGDEARRVRVWEEDADVVWVHSDEEYRKRTDDIQARWAVGFHREMVYQDNPELFATEDPLDLWSLLEPFV